VDPVPLAMCSVIEYGFIQNHRKVIEQKSLNATEWSIGEDVNSLFNCGRIRISSQAH
jgi:hypothetical protein